jgi:hypothetical protein
MEPGCVTQVVQGQLRSNRSASQRDQQRDRNADTDHEESIHRNPPPSAGLDPPDSERHVGPKQDEGKQQV